MEKINFQDNITKANAGAGYTSILNVATFSVTKTSGYIFMLATSNTARTCRYLVVGKIAGE